MLKQHLPDLHFPGMAVFTMSVVALWSVGCGGGPDLVPVSGRITLDDQPLAGALINTQPIGDMDNPNPGQGSFGRTDEDGRYTLALATHSREGAVVGKHRVTVIMEEDAFSEDPTNDLPQTSSRYWPEHFTDNSLTIDVPPGGTDNADLQLYLK